MKGGGHTCKKKEATFYMKNMKKKRIFKKLNKNVYGLDYFAYIMYWLIHKQTMDETRDSLKGWAQLV